MSENISKVLDKIENKLKWQQEKLKLMRKIRLVLNTG